MIRSYVLIAAAVLAASPGRALAHGEAVLESAASSVPAGGEVPVRGSAFEAEERYRLLLVGALAEYPLPEVTADSAGAFSVDLRIPPEVSPGRYRLVAVAPDGDRVASLELVVVRAVGGGPEEAAGQVSGEGAGGRRPRARADELPIQRSMEGVEWGVIGLVIGLAGGLGLGLLRRSRAGE